jgi:hypothetical protein
LEIVMRLMRFVVAMLCVAGMANLAGAANSQALSASADGYMHREFRWGDYQPHGYFRDHYYGSLSTGYSDGNNWNYPFIQFDMTALPATAVIQSAVLSIHATSAGALSPVPNVIGCNSDAWSDSSFSYDTVNDAGYFTVSSNDWSADTQTQWLSVELDQWDSSADVLDGALSLRLSNDSWYSYHSRESSYAPTLELVYIDSSQVPTPTAAGMIGLIGVLAMRRRR